MTEAASAAWTGGQESTTSSVTAEKEGECPQPAAAAGKHTAAAAAAHAEVAAAVLRCKKVHMPTGDVPAAAQAGGEAVNSRAKPYSGKTRNRYCAEGLPSLRQLRERGGWAAPPPSAPRQ